MPLIADFDQLAVVGLLHIVGAHPLEHVAEQAELLVGIGSSRPRARAVEQDTGLGRHQRQGRARRRTKENEGSLAHASQTFLFRLWPLTGPCAGQEPHPVCVIRNEQSGVSSNGTQGPPGMESPNGIPNVPVTAIIIPGSLA